MSSLDNNSTRVAAHAIPEPSRYMLGHIGGIGTLNDINKTSTTDDVDLDTDINYTKEQKSLIDASKKTIYQRTQHNETFDIPETGFNTVQNQHPYGVNMITNHSDRGYDYRDFPLELEKKRIDYDPYTGWLTQEGIDR